VATAVGDMISGFFKLRNAADKMSHMNKGNSQELSALAAELPNSPELEALLHCFNYDMRVIDVDGRERVIRDGIKERMRYLSGQVDPQRLGYMEYVDPESKDRAESILNYYAPEIKRRYGDDFDAKFVLDKWKKLLDSGMSVDVEGIEKQFEERVLPDGSVEQVPVGMYKDWSEKELQFAREVLTCELWSDPDHQYNSITGRNISGQEIIIPVFLDDSSFVTLNKIWLDELFRFWKPICGGVTTSN
jgi:hypothetical protein